MFYFFFYKKEIIKIIFEFLIQLKLARDKACKYDNRTIEINIMAKKNSSSNYKFIN